MQTCRLIDDETGTGAYHMAVDETLLRTAAETGLATLRFYRWHAPTLSLGYFQQIEHRRQHMASQSCDVVRRASGGGAILHDRELTYCFAAPIQSRFGDSQHSYAVFHETLIDTLAELGVSARLHEKDDGLSDSAFLCFQRRASGDIVCAGEKIMGSAQRRWKKAVVQHGSLLLASSIHAPELPGLRELTESDLPVETLIQDWLQRLTWRLNIAFKTSSLTDKERGEAETLTREKFLDSAWTERR
jgi:lipoate-protein ligase A